LQTIARTWPTPTSKLGDERRGSPSADTAAKRFGQGKRNLDDAVALWPTSTARDSKSVGGENHPEHGGPSLPNMVLKHWPTPCSADADRASGQFARGNPTLTGAIRGLWPTPTAQDADASGAAAYSTESGRHTGTTLTDATVRANSPPTDSLPGPARSKDGMVLSPRFVEALMGMPDGWVVDTPYASSGTRACRRRQRSRSRCSRKEPPDDL